MVRIDSLRQRPAPDKNFLTVEGLRKIHGEELAPSLVPVLPLCRSFLCLQIQTSLAFQNYVQKQKDSGILGLLTPTLLTIGWEQGLAASILINEDGISVENITSHATSRYKKHLLCLSA